MKFVDFFIAVWVGLDDNDDDPDIVYLVLEDTGRGGGIETLSRSSKRKKKDGKRKYHRIIL
jgi:hypothetical protein